MRGKLTLTIVLVLSPLMMTGCGMRPPAPVPETPVETQVWPAPPAPPRIRYVRSLHGPHDLGIVKPWFQRVAETLFGKTEEYFIRPTGVTEHDGVLYVADPGAQALWIFNVPQQRFTKITRINKTPLASPVAVAARSDGAVFVADSWLKKVFLLDREGKPLRVFIDGGLERPAALAYDAATDRLYVADSIAHRIGVYGPDGARASAWGKRGGGDGEFNYPTHLAFDGTGALLVTDALNFRIQAFDRDGRFLWKMGRHGDGSGDLAAPKGVAADSRGQIYIVDALFDAVQIFERKGSLLLAFGERGIRRGQFWLPGGIFINPEDLIYVADAYNQRVQVFELLGELNKANTSKAQR